MRRLRVLKGLVVVGAGKDGRGKTVVRHSLVEALVRAAVAVVVAVAVERRE